MTFSINGTGVNWIAIWKIMNLDPYLISHQQQKAILHSLLIKKKKDKTIKEDKTGCFMALAYLKIS